jgi:hypothetical protein
MRIVQRMARSGSAASALIVLAAMGCAVRAQDLELAKQRTNPLAHLATATFQFNDDCCLGAARASAFTLSNQFVVPIDINDQWFVLSRTVLPYISVPPTAARVPSHSGLGDTTQSFFLSPRQAGDLIIGVGPAFNLPTATDPALGFEKWGAGPTITVVQQTGGWTLALLSHHIWSFTGAADRKDVRYTYVAAGVAYTFPDTTTLAIGTETVRDWTIDQAPWSVPIIAGYNHLYRVGDQAFTFGFSGKYYAATPIGGPKWGARATLTFLYPK